MMQEDVPCISESDSFIYDSHGMIVKAAYGDGGLYTAMLRYGNALAICLSLRFLSQQMQA